MTLLFFTDNVKSANQIVDKDNSNSGISAIQNSPKWIYIAVCAGIGLALIALIAVFVLVRRKRRLTRVTPIDMSNVNNLEMIQMAPLDAEYIHKYMMEKSIEPSELTDKVSDDVMFRHVLVVV